MSAGIPPSGYDFFVTVSSIPSFFFAKADTLLVASILALEMWHNKLNLKFNMLSEDGLYFSVIKIMENSDDLRFKN